MALGKGCQRVNAITLLTPAQGAACAPCSHLLPFPSCHSFWKSSGECPWFSWSILGLHRDPLAPDLLPGCSLLKRSGGGISSLGFGVSWSWEQMRNVPGSGDGKAPSPASSTQGSTRKDISQLNPRLPGGTRDLGEVVVMNSPSRCPFKPGSFCEPQIRKGTET